MNVADSRREAAAAAVGAQLITLADERYPPLLRTIHDPPQRLYVRGDAALLSQPQLSIVGSRRASAAGLRAASTLAAQLVAAGLHVCSGLARGIDGAAHRGALDGGGSSVAVMATGIDQVYPAAHRQLATALQGAGCLVTELPPGTPPRRQHFPRRNRIISGLSLGVLVVEAALPSGSLITAGTALEQGREVFALPWSVFHVQGAGCLHLLRDGAKMVQRVEDVLEELDPLLSLQREMTAPEGAPAGQLAPELRPLAELVGCDAVSVDELVQASALPVAQVIASLSQLELAGVVTRCAGGYIRC
ncbi:MAG: DNA-processing protein DprA [Halioglobus sp.]|nr:DNA-processing protein DprA [Halioglobus sp.]